MKSSEQRGASRIAPKKIQLILKLAQTYHQMSNLPVVGAMNCDPTPVSHSPRWTPTSAGFVTDCEHALRDVLAGRPDRTELVRAFVRLSVDGSVIGPSEATLIELLAPIVRSRHLAPYEYFKPRPGRRVAAA